MLNCIQLIFFWYGCWTYETNLRSFTVWMVELLAQESVLLWVQGLNPWLGDDFCFNIHLLQYTLVPLRTTEENCGMLLWYLWFYMSRECVATLHHRKLNSKTNVLPISGGLAKKYDADYQYKTFDFCKEFASFCIVSYFL